MRSPTALRLAASAVSAALAAGTLSAAATAGDATPAEELKKVTPAGVGKVKVGKTYRRLREQGLVRRIRPGCELGGPGTRSAKLKRPLEGQVDFTRRRPRRVRSITITGGAAARGVGIGATIPEIRDAFPKAKVDHGTDETFGVTLVKVPKRGGGRIMFAVDVGTDRVTIVGVPYIAFCE